MFKRDKEMEKVAEAEKIGGTDVSPLGNKSGTDPKANRSVIGEQISIEGTIRGKGDLMVEGAVKGNIEVAAHHLTIGLKGKVESEIHAADVTISGNLKGNVYAKGKVAITKEAVFNGEINARSISVEDGAYLKATIELMQEPRKEADLKGKLAGSPFPETGRDTPVPAGKIGGGN